MDSPRDGTLQHPAVLQTLKDYEWQIEYYHCAI